MPADVDGALVEQRIAEAAAVLGSVGGVTGWAALRWAGGSWFAGRTSGGALERPVTLAVGGASTRPQRGVAITKERLGRRELIVLDGLRVTTVIRSLFFELRYAPGLRQAVEALDMAAYDDLVSLSEVSGYLSDKTGWTGIEQARKAVLLGHENSWSPRETWLRLVWVLDAGLAPPLCNVPVFDLDGRHLGTPDLFDPGAGVLCEYDGVLHLEGRRRRRDLERLERFREAGLEMLTVVSGQPPSAVAHMMMRLRHRALSQPRRARRWTLQQPSWWVRTDSVDLRRSLEQGDRTIWLSHRRAVS